VTFLADHCFFVCGVERNRVFRLDEHRLSHLQVLDLYKLALGREDGVFACDVHHPIIQV
jgi:hypothetical protein